MHENISKLSLSELRQMWANEWGKRPHARIGRSMLEKSLKYKIYEHSYKILTSEQSAQLSNLIKKYKSNPYKFEENPILKTGTRLVRLYKGKKHIVLVHADRFEYGQNNYTSLSKIAKDITGKKWNGWVFFGLKKVGCK